jgi:hypothetical protein
LALAFDTAPDGGWSSIAIASKRADDVVHVELVDRRAGVGWLAGEVIRLVHRHDIGEVVMDPQTPAKTALTALEDADIKVTELHTSDVTTAFAMFVSACADKALAHIDQAELNAALNGAARRRIGDSYAWSRRTSGVDISPICAVTAAHWAALTRADRRPEAHSLHDAVVRMASEGRLPPHLAHPGDAAAIPPRPGRPAYSTNWLASSDWARHAPAFPGIYIPQNNT